MDEEKELHSKTEEVIPLDGETVQSPEKIKAEKISELSKEGYQLLKEDNYKKAEDCFFRILELEENNNYALVGLGDAARKMRKFNKAITYYQQCLELFDSNNYALFGLADCYKAMNQYNKAIKIWEEYLLQDSDNITVLTRVADAYRKVRSFKKSKDLYQRVLDLEQNNAYALIGLGHLHYDFKEFREALYYWEKMVELHRDSIDIRVLTSIGNCHRKLRTYEEGLKSFSMALDLDHHNFYALFGLADCYRGLNRNEESLDCWLRILEKDPENKVILTRAGDAYREMEDLTNAEKYYQKALNIEFDSFAVIGLALLNKARGNYKEAIESLTSLMLNDPRNHRLYTEAAECYLALGDKTKALEILSVFQKKGMHNSFINRLADKIRNGR